MSEWRRALLLFSAFQSCAWVGVAIACFDWTTPLPLLAVAPPILVFIAAAICDDPTPPCDDPTPPCDEDEPA